MRFAVSPRMLDCDKNPPTRPSARRITAPIAGPDDKVTDDDGTGLAIWPVLHRRVP